MALDELLRSLYPHTQPFFGLDRELNRVLRENAAQRAWAKRGRLRQLWDWALRKQPPPGPRLVGFKLDAEFNNQEKL